MRFALAVSLAIAACLPAVAGDSSSRPDCRPEVRGAWIRMTPTMPMGAGYFTIENRCAREFVVVGASSTRFARVSMHETRIDQGVSRMRALATVVLRPGARFEFSPRGRHLMLLQPRTTLQAGGTVRIDLRLAQGGRIPVDFAVRGVAP